MSFYLEKRYICICGKEFTNSQAYNGHKCRCLKHLTAKYGKEEALIRFHQNDKKSQATRILVAEERKHQKLVVWISEQHKCEVCGKIMTEKFGTGRFCCDRCAHFRIISDETKNKIRNTLCNTLEQKQLSSPRDKLKPRSCIVCGKQFIPKLIGNGHKVSTSRVCSENCCREHQRQMQLQIMGEGRHKGWMRRGKLSYAEKFWKTVLENNNIDFQYEYPVACNNTHYLLDFFIEPNIDLEIDGKQHKYPDRAQHDLERTTHLEELGYIVYRIPWINPAKQKDEVQNQINAFLEFINSKK